RLDAGKDRLRGEDTLTVVPQKQRSTLARRQDDVEESIQIEISGPGAVMVALDDGVRQPGFRRDIRQPGAWEAQIPVRGFEQPFLARAGGKVLGVGVEANATRSNEKQTREQIPGVPIPRQHPIDARWSGLGSRRERRLEPSGIDSSNPPRIGNEDGW